MVQAETTVPADSNEQIKPSIASGQQLLTWVQIGAALAGVPINQPGKPGNITIAQPTSGGDLMFTDHYGCQLILTLGRNSHDWVVDQVDANGEKRHYRTTGCHALMMVLKLVLGQPE